MAGQRLRDNEEGTERLGDNEEGRGTEVRSKMMGQGGGDGTYLLPLRAPVQCSVNKVSVSVTFPAGNSA